MGRRVGANVGFRVVGLAVGVRVVGLSVGDRVDGFAVGVRVIGFFDGLRVGVVCSWRICNVIGIEDRSVVSVLVLIISMECCEIIIIIFDNMRHNTLYALL